MNLIIVSPFWNSEKYVDKCIQSLKNQYYTNFTAYFIDDMSTDKSYEVAKKTIGNDERFILIKNTTKKYKTKNFIDVIRDNPKIRWDDVIIEIDGDDKLKDSHVLGLINKVFTDNNIWLCGTKWCDDVGRLGNYGKPNPERARTTSWNFSHMRSFRAFLFRSILDEHLKFEGEYFKAGCDLGHGIPMLEMSGSEHFHYIDEPTYVYTWHDKQSYSNNNSFGDKTVQGRTAKYIYSLPKYEKLNFEFEFEVGPTEDFTIKPEFKISNKEIIKSLFGNKELNKTTVVDYEKINQIMNKKGVYNVNSSIKPVRENVPKDRNELMNIKKGSIADQSSKMFPSKPNRRSDAPNIFGGRIKN